MKEKIAKALYNHWKRSDSELNREPEFEDAASNIRRVFEGKADAVLAALLEGGTEEYFVSESWPHKWTSGPTILTMNPEKRFAPFESLDEVKEIAEKRNNPKWGYEECCIANYGVTYTFELERGEND